MKSFCKKLAVPRKQNRTRPLGQRCVLSFLSFCGGSGGGSAVVVAGAVAAAVVVWVTVVVVALVVVVLSLGMILCLQIV